MMIRMLCILVCLGFAVPILGQQDTALSKQCSAIRELVYLGTQQHFEPIIDQRLSGSHGYQANGRWTFSNEHLSTTLPWQGATSTTIEHSTDFRDTVHTKSWQYIAVFKPLADPLYASRFLQNMVEQINSCVLPLTDSISINLVPVDPAELPPNKPDNLADAYLFYLPPVIGLLQQTSIMLGLEKTRQGLRPMLMVEVLEELKYILPQRH